MGAGASAVESIEKKDYSVEELQAFAAGLSEEDFKKVQAALATTRSTGGYIEDASGAVAPADELTIEYSDDWADSMQDKLMAFAMSIGANPGTHDCKVVTSQGREVLHDEAEGVTKDAFPLKVRFFAKNNEASGDDGAAAFSVITAVSEYLSKRKAELTAGLLEGNDSAPFLREYFQKQYKFAMENTPASMEQMMELAFDPEAQAAVKKKSQDFYKAECKPLLEQSFAKHDKDGSKTLCKEEAAIFFKNISVDNALFSKALLASMMEKSILQGLEMMMGMCGGQLSASDAKEASDEMKKGVAKQLDECTKAMDTMQQSYLENADARNAEAFKVLDTSGDGTLQLDEFLAAFDPSTEKNDAFVSALGLKPAEPVQPAQEGPGECCLM